LSCQETQRLLHAHVDGELDLQQSTEMEQHLQECAVCAQAYADLQTLRQAIRERAPYFETPASLHQRIRSSVGLPSSTVSRPWLPLRGLAVAASLAFISLIVWSLLRVGSDRLSLPDVVVASYVRSEMLPGHRVDVESSNQHTVKPWFAGKIDFAPSVPDLKDQGFDLIGGRLDYLDKKAVAALVYQRRKHRINLFVWPASPGMEAAAKASSLQGYHLIHWIHSGMNYWAISDLNETELQEFVRDVQARTP